MDQEFQGEDRVPSIYPTHTWDFLLLLYVARHTRLFFILIPRCEPSPEKPDRTEAAQTHRDMPVMLPCLDGEAHCVCV